MFFESLGVEKKRASLKAPPPVPETNWRPPNYFPDLSDATVIGFDVERKEHDWEHGPGWCKGLADTVGFSVAARDRMGNLASWYLPIGHELDRSYNLDPTAAKRWLKATLETPHIPKAGANLLYDIGSLTDDGINVQGELHDCQFAEALLNSDGEVNLDHLGYKYLGEGKETNQLYKWLAEAYGGKPNGDQRSNIWRASPRLVGPYGETDALHPIRILEKQWPLLAKDGLLDLYRMECKLIPLLVQMRINGVTVNLEAVEKLYSQLAIDIDHGYSELFAETGVAIESVNSGKDIAKLFDAAGVQYPLTEAGNPSFRKDWLATLDHPIADRVNAIREMEKVRGTFLKNYILEGHIKGKIHCQFHPLRGDDGGTVTGRFSSSDPNLQNIPVRTELGKQIRKAFVKDQEHLMWEKIDYSQIEYRYLAHYAVGPGSEELRTAYNLDPKTDYHVQTQNNVKAVTGRLIERRPIKNMNFGLVYGMQEKKLIRQNNFTPQEGKEIFKAYHTGNPYVKPTMKAAADEIAIFGYITTILNRRTHFNLWEPIDRDYTQPRELALPYDYAIRRYGSRIKRANGHKAINYRLQGSAADQIKKGMHDCYCAGVFDTIGVPRLQIHDELGFSVIDDTPIAREAYSEMYHILETCVTLKVPVRVDHKRGETWGHCE